MPARAPRHGGGPRWVAAPGRVPNRSHPSGGGLFAPDRPLPFAFSVSFSFSFSSVLVLSVRETRASASFVLVALPSRTAACRRRDGSPGPCAHMIGAQTSPRVLHGPARPAGPSLLFPSARGRRRGSTLRRLRGAPPPPPRPPPPPPSPLPPPPPPSPHRFPPPRRCDGTPSHDLVEYEAVPSSFTPSSPLPRRSHYLAAAAPG